MNLEGDELNLMHSRRAGGAPTKGSSQNGALCISSAAIRLSVRVVGKLCLGCVQLIHDPEPDTRTSHFDAVFSFKSLSFHRSMHHGFPDAILFLQEPWPWSLLRLLATPCVIAAKACSPGDILQTYDTNAAPRYVAASRVFLPENADNARFKRVYRSGISHDVCNPSLKRKVVIIREENRLPLNAVRWYRHRVPYQCYLGYRL